MYDHFQKCMEGRREVDGMDGWKKGNLFTFSCVVRVLLINVSQIQSTSDIGYALTLG